MEESEPLTNETPTQDVPPLTTTGSQVTANSPKSSKKLYFIGVILFLLILLTIVSQLFLANTDTEETPQQQTIESPTAVPQRISVPTITPVPSSGYRNPIIDKNIPTGAQPALIPLTQQEQSFPEAKPQSFPSPSPDEGTLVVNSSQQGVTIRIDVLSDEEGSGHGESFFVQTNSVPFKYSNLPAGYYTLDARKDNYDQRQYIIRVEPDKVTRVNVQLNPL